MQNNEETKSESFRLFDHPRTSASPEFVRGERRLHRGVFVSLHSDADGAAEPYATEQPDSPTLAWRWRSLDVATSENLAPVATCWNVSEYPDSSEITL